MKNKLNKKQKAFVDELFKNGFNQTNAYVSVYGVTNRNYAKIAASRMMTNDNVRFYYEHLYKQHREKLDIDKQKMLDILVDEMNLFAEMKALAQKDDLTYEEEMKLSRLSNLLKASDINKVRDMINKMIGTYEPEKQEVSVTVKAKFGELPTNKNII
jgi:hypothetical protein